MGDAANYDALIPLLDPNAYTYVFADLRGYGRSRHLTGDFSAAEVAADAFRLADHLGWQRFHVIGHSMTGMVVQRMALDDWTSKARRLKSVIAITPVAADGYPADADTKQFLWDLIGDRILSEHGFSLLTGARLLPSWSRAKTTRHLQTSSPEALAGYYRMWLQTDFSGEVRQADIKTPFLVIGGRQDLPGFQEQHLRKTFGEWFVHVDFAFVTDAGHYPMQETPIYLATLIEGFLDRHRGEGLFEAERCAAARGAEGR
jgi:pimeloyl-ACP methyl ester carboxylesterase